MILLNMLVIIAESNFLTSASYGTCDTIVFYTCVVFDNVCVCDADHLDIRDKDNVSCPNSFTLKYCKFVIR